MHFTHVGIIIQDCLLIFILQVRDYNGERTLDGLTKFVETDGEGAEPVPSVVSILINNYYFAYPLYQIIAKYFIQFRPCENSL